MLRCSCVVALVLACALPLSRCARPASAGPRTQKHLLLGEPTNVAPLPGLLGDKAVSVHAVCGVHGSHKKLKCAVPPPLHGISPRWANVSAPMVDLRGDRGLRDGCKALVGSSVAGGVAGSAAGRIALVGSGGGCTLAAKARRAAAAGFLGLLVVEDKKWARAKAPRGKGKGATLPEREQHLALPCALLSKSAAKQLLARAQPRHLPDAKAAGKPGSSPHVLLSLKALARKAGSERGAFWKGPTTLYQEGMKMLSQARALRDGVGDWLAAPPAAADGGGGGGGGGAAAAPLPVPREALDLYQRAIASFRLSVKLEPRAHVAQHELSNALMELAALTPRPDTGGNGDAAAAVAAIAAMREEARGIVGALVGVNATHKLTYASRCKEGNAPAIGRSEERGGKLRIVAVATDPRPQLAALIQTVRVATGQELEVIGMGTTYPGLGLKLMAMARWLPSVPDEDYVLMVDAYDVLFLHDAAELLARFRSFCAPLVFGAETRCHPDTALTLVHPPKAAAQPFHYLNSGTYMGRASDVKRMFGQIFGDLREHYSWGGADYRQVNDQRWFTRHWFLHHEDVVLDVHGEIFHTLHQVDYSAFGREGPQGSFLSNVTKSRPCVVHGNGKDGKDTINKFIKRFRASGWIPAAPL